MSEPKLISPLLDGFLMGEPISDHDGVRCCPAMRENSDDKYIVKIISVPASQKQLDALLLTGAYKDAAAAAEYFKELANDTVKEARLLQQLAKLEGFLSYEGWQIVPMEGDEVGYDIYLLGSYKRSLEKFLRRSTMTHLGAVNLGLDLCAALSLCRRAGFIYTALNPSNIFITGKQEYRIGDLGFAKLSAMKYTSLPQRYIGRYTPPELHDPLATLNPTVDIYAVGMILYQIYNNGEIPFAVKAPMKVLPAPLNADYEMAEIILKACHPNPRKRYQTPIEMGQALVSYMQRNSVNDVPIVPPSVEPALSEPLPAAEEIIPQPEAEVPAQPTAEEAVPEISAEETGAMPEELRFMDDLVSDDTAPGADEDDDQMDVQTTDEVDLILAQADALISHTVDLAPEPAETIPEEDASEESETVQASEPVQEAEPAQELAAEEAAPAESTIEAVSPDEPDEDDDLSFDISATDEIPDDAGNLEFGLPEDESAADAKNSDGNDFFQTAAPQKKRGWIGIVIVLLVLALAAGGVYYYFDNFYILHIDNMVIDGFQDSLTVELNTAVKEELLKVVCTDTYGNKKELPVSDGKATFTGLTADTMYKITVEAEGFHRVSGACSGSYTTSAQTNVVDFSAKAGMEDGSVILSFTVDGPETQEWTVEYAAEGEEVKSVSFTGHMVTINDLTVGKLYTFTLVAPASSEIYLTGSTTLEYMASNIITAQNLSIISCVDGVLTAQWSVPMDAAADSWTVRCYSQDGYDETITVTETEAQFSGISAEHAYTVEVTATGMSQGVNAYVTASPVAVSNVQVSYNAETGMTISWNASGTPAGGWLVMYSVDGSETTEMAECTGTAAVVRNVIPNAAYRFQIKAADGSTVFGGTAEHPGIEATDFDCYGLSADKIQSSLCRRPAKEGWTHEDVGDNDYTTSFAAGEKASLVLYTSSTFYLKSEDISVTFVIRNEHGQVIPSLTRTLTRVWRELWPGVGKYCYLDIPVMPTADGKYTVEIYFNGATVLSKNFSIITTNG